MRDLPQSPVPLDSIRPHLFSLAEAVEHRFVAAEAAAGYLTQAILAKAFQGEIVPTESELARWGGRDSEPARVLLERIKAECAA